MLDSVVLTDDEVALQQRVRTFLDRRLAPGTYPVGLGMPGEQDAAFSRDLAAEGWVGMAVSTEHGGGGRSAVERLLVVEELLARGAPVSHHWVADRQSGPSIERYGTPEQKRAYLPGITSGELSFAIGMSEPDAGSDLASVRSRAEFVDGQWVVNGTKVWTSGAVHATHILGLFRTSPDRYRGMTQFIVPCDTPGLTIRPIETIDGSRHFCELVFDDVRLADGQRLGEVGSGWEQNTSELVLERGGVDRFMSAFPLVERWWRRGVGDDPGQRAELGTLLARMWVLRAMSLSLARQVDRKVFPSTTAALLKEMGTRFEQECVDTVARHVEADPATPEDDTAALLEQALLVSPSWSIRGGTSEILRTIIAKGLVRDV